MASRTFVRDATGVAQQLKRWAVRDAGGTTRLLKRAFVRDAAGVSRLIFQSNKGTFEVDIGVQAFESGGSPPIIVYYSYSNGTSGPPLGSLISSDVPIGTPYAFSTGHNESTGVYDTILDIGGIASDPGQAYFSTLVASFGGSLSSAAATYSFVDGVAQWTWAGSNFISAGAPSGGDITVTLMP
jgi:hypothetical protein